MRSRWSICKTGQGKRRGDVGSEEWFCSVTWRGRNYLDQKPPKSLDINDLKLVPELEALSIPDACATLTAFTTECMVDSLRWIEQRQIEVPRLWIVAGGGWENPAILASLIEKLVEHLGPDVRVQKADAVGWNGKALEAQIFAYLGVRSLKGLPLSAPWNYRGFKSSNRWNARSSPRKASVRQSEKFPCYGVVSWIKQGRRAPTLHTLSEP